MKPALRAIFTSPAFYGEKAKFALIKSPTELAVETARNLGAAGRREREARLIDQHVKAMDQVLFQPPNVRGWVGGDNWITAATLYARYNTACAMVNGTLAAAGCGECTAARGAARARRVRGERLRGMKPASAPPATRRRGQPTSAADAGAGEDDRENGATGAAGGAGDGRGPTGGGVAGKLFPGLPQDPTAEQVVDAAVSRFLQRPLQPGKEGRVAPDAERRADPPRDAGERPARARDDRAAAQHAGVPGALNQMAPSPLYAGSFSPSPCTQGRGSG